MLREENKILKSTIHSIETSLDLVKRVNHDLDQYTRRECVEIRGIPVAATPSEGQTNDIVKNVGKLIGVDITESDVSVIECLYVTAVIVRLHFLKISFTLSLSGNGSFSLFELCSEPVALFFSLCTSFLSCSSLRG